MAILGRKPRNILERFWGKVDIKSENECWNWLAWKDKDGYGRLRNGRYLPQIRVHRFSYELHYGKEVPENMLVCHTCDNPSCVNPKHLYVGTPKDNAVDRDRRGRRKLKITNAKLTRNQVEQIRNLFQSGEYSKSKLGRMFGVSESNIYYIVLNKSWR